MRLTSKILLFFLICFLYSKGEIQRVSLQDSKEQKSLKGYIVPKDQIRKPKIVQAGMPRIVKALNPVIVKEQFHTKLGEKPMQFEVSIPQPAIPGQGGYSVPVSKSSVGITFPAAIPEVILAKDLGSKDFNPLGFTSVGTIQGLKTNQIRSMAQDHLGNLWFSSDDGVTRYDGKYLSHFDVSNGEHQNNIILSILEDRSGSLWFGTFGNGVLCFDGKKYTQYTEKEGLANNIVNSIIQDRAGNFWMATSGGGVSKFDGKTFTNYSTNEGLAGNQVRALFEDKEGKIWIGTFGNGISRFDGKGFTNFTKKEGFPVTHVATIMQDKNGQMWFGSFNQGLLKYDGRTFFQYTDKQGLGNNTVLCMVQDANGTFWLGTSGGGISRFDGKIFSNYTEEDGLTNNYIRCALVGHQGNLWFGTRDGGLVRYNKDLFSHYSDNEGLAGSKVYGIMQDDDKNLWFSSFGGGITRYDGKEFAAYSLKETELNNFVYTIIKRKNSDIWFGSDGGGITKFDGKQFTQYTQKEGLCNNSVRCMLEDRKGNIWVGTYGGGVSKFDGRTFTNYTDKEGLSSNKVMCILEDTDGTLWFGTDGGGITSFDGNTFKHFSLREGLNRNTFTSLLQDKRGALWFGSSGGGLTRFDGTNIISFTKKEGLSNDYITSLKQDKEGNLWIGTRLGPNILKADQMRSNFEQSKPPVFRNYSYDDGFLGIGCNLNAIFEDDKGIIWIGATNRLSAIRPKEEIPDTIAPQIRLMNIQLFNENIPWSKVESNKDTSFVLGNGVEVGDFRFSTVSKWYFLPENHSLAHDNNFLTFYYVGISQKQTQKIRYRYQLEGLESRWSSPTELTEISYGNLKQGNYLFKVKAINSEGISSDEGKYAFTIRSPWWQSWWFYSLLVIGIISLIYSYIKWREYEHKLQRDLLNKKIEEQTFELKEKNRELESKNDQLQTANSEKDKFFSIIAHDVRGPLSTFMLFTEILSENLSSYEMKEIQTMVGSMKDSASGLFKLLENLLEWARMQRGLIMYNPEQLNIIEVFSESVDTIHQSAKNKSIALLVDISSDIEVIADKNMVESVIRNLLSNAIKFTPKGGKVTVKAEKWDDNFVCISMTDTGIGMDDEMIREVFKIDSQNNRRGTDGEMSAGLGLLLCKDFVEKQNGKIWAESKVGHGSTFYFTLESAPKS